MARQRARPGQDRAFNPDFRWVPDNPTVPSKGRLVPIHDSGPYRPVAKGSKFSYSLEQTADMTRAKTAREAITQKIVDVKKALEAKSR